MTNKQKTILITGLGIIIVSFIIWISSGSEIFTKTQVLIEKKDQLFGTTYKEWQDRFVWGLDLTVAITSAVVLAGGFLFYLLRIRKNHK